MVNKFNERGANKNMWEHWNIGQFSKGTREQGSPMGDPHLHRTYIASAGFLILLASFTV